MEFEVVDEVPSARRAQTHPDTIAAVEAAHANPGKWIRITASDTCDADLRRGRLDSQLRKMKTLTAVKQRGVDLYVRWDPPKPPSELLPHVCETCERGFATRAALARHRQEEDHYQDEAS